VNKKLRKNPTTTTELRYLKQNSTDATQTSNNIIPVLLTLLFPLKIKYDGDTCIFREVIPKTELLRFYGSQAVLKV
jgi:hypothetical protein